MAQFVTAQKCEKLGCTEYDVSRCVDAYGNTTGYYCEFHGVKLGMKFE